MNEESKIKCPHCGKELSSSIFEDHFKKELENLGSREKEFKEKEATILADAKKKAEEQAQTNLKEKEKKIEEEALKKAKEQAQSELKEKEKKIKEEAFKKAKEQAQKELKEKAIIDAKKEVEEENEDIKRTHKALQLNFQRVQEDLKKANKKISQGSSELQGEVQERLIEDFLRERFPNDSIEEIKKGTRGADCIQSIILKEKVIGKIIYESKDTQVFDEKWIKKLLNDLAEQKANFGIIVTSALPRNARNQKVTWRHNNLILICPMDFELLYILANSMRNQIVGVSKSENLRSMAPEKAEKLWKYITGSEFKSLVNSFLEEFEDGRKLIDAKERTDQLFIEKMRKNIDSKMRNFNKILVNLDASSGVKKIEGDDNDNNKN